MKKKLQAILEKLSLSSKSNEKKLTTDDIKNIETEVKKELKMSLQEALSKVASEEKKAKKADAKIVDAIAAMLAKADADDEKEDEDEEKAPDEDDDEGDDKEEKDDDEAEADEDEEEEEEDAKEEDDDDDEEENAQSGDDEEKKGGSGKKKSRKKPAEKHSSVVGKVKKLISQNKKLSAKVEVDKPKEKVKMKTQQLAVVLGAARHTKTHLFGISDPLYAISNDDWWNQVTATGKPLLEHPSDGVETFQKAFNKFGVSVKDRYASLITSGQLAQLNFKKMAAGEGSIDYSDLENELGGYYRTRRTDLIIAYLRQFESVTSIFPIINGVQDQMEVTNSFFGEFSQAWQPGRWFKGNVKFQPMIASVKDAMFKHEFSDLKKLEKEYIGYFNREGSDPIKWTFLEWIFVELAKKLDNEFNIRAVQGYRIEPVPGKNAHFLHAADGYVRAVEKYEEQLYILPFEMGTYNRTTIVDYVEELMEQLNRILPTISGIKLYINKKHVPWYLANFREKYGDKNDFSGTKLTAIDYSSDVFIPVPNLPHNYYKMALTFEGNFECYQLVPGEMHKLYFQRDLESLMAMSIWKEGFGAKMVGERFKTAAELAASKRLNQFIFTNDGVTELAPGATTANADLNLFFKTSANAAATTLTDIENAVPGVVYRIICGGTAYATKITKAGVFSEISSAWTPTAVGDYIKLTLQLESDGAGKLAPTGKFVEVDRKVTPAA